MKLIINIFNVLKKINQWYQEPIPGHRLIRTDPVTIALIFMFAGCLATIHQFYQGAQQLDESKDVADQWRNASTEYQDQINNAFDENEISVYEREVALQRLEEMTPIFLDVANAIEVEGRENFENAAYQGLVDSAINLIPFSQVGQGGRLVGLVGLGDLYTAYGLSNYVDTLGQSPFSEDQEALINVGNILITNNPPPPSEEQSQINQEIMAVFGDDADAFFIARMQTHIKYIRRFYIMNLRENPCMVEQALSDLRTELNDIGWGENIDLYGEGEKWPTYEAFIDWLITQAVNKEDEDTTLTLKGNIEMASTTTEPCSVCVPPTLTGTITLTINLQTCEIQGTLLGEGSGTAERNACDVGSDQVDVGCTAQGEASFSGNFLASIDPSGNLTLESGSVLLESNIGWIEGPCEGSASGSSNINVSMTGTVDIENGASGNIQLLHPDCAILGEWSASLN